MRGKGQGQWANAAGQQLLSQLRVLWPKEPLKEKVWQARGETPGKVLKKGTSDTATLPCSGSLSWVHQGRFPHSHDSFSAFCLLGFVVGFAYLLFNFCLFIKFIFFIK